MLFGEKQTKRSAVEKEVKKIIKGIMKSYEKEEITPLSGTKCVPVIMWFALESSFGTTE